MFALLFGLTLCQKECDIIMGQKAGTLVWNNFSIGFLFVSQIMDFFLESLDSFVFELVFCHSVLSTVDNIL